MIQNNRVRNNRKARKTHYGKVVTPTTYSTPAKPKTPVAPRPKFAPVSDEVTVYGAKKFRTPYSKDSYVGTKGTRPTAVILDIDGTLTDFGSSPNKTTMEWVKKHHDLGDVLVVITARDEGMFTTSFNWLLHNLPYPFIGPFCRSSDDPRYASEFKRELAEDLAKTFDFVGAADDNKYVLDMWKQWAKDHHVDPKDFDILECGYSSYSGWRKGLPSVGYGTQSYGGYGKSQYPASTSHYGASSHRKAGENTTPTTWGLDPADKKWKKVTEFIDEAAPLSIEDNPAWQAYFNRREQAGAYVNEPQDDLDDVLDELEEKEGYTLYREDLKQIVRRDFPGYSEEELDDMSITDLRENAGIVGEWSDTEYKGLFSDEQLGVQHPEMEETPEERRARVDYRLDMEEELFALDQDLNLSTVMAMDLKEIENRIADWYAKNEVPLADSPLRKADDAANTAPLDVAEVLLSISDEAQSA